MKCRNKYSVAILILCASLLNTVHAQQAIWGKSPKELFETIGNPQFDLRDQGSAYENLKDKAAGDPRAWGGDANSIKSRWSTYARSQKSAGRDSGSRAGSEEPITRCTEATRTNDKMTPPNKSPEPTAVGAVSSAIAVHVASRRWLSFFR